MPRLGHVNKKKIKKSLAEMVDEEKPKRKKLIETEELRVNRMILVYEQEPLGQKIKLVNTKHINEVPATTVDG
jgi:galactokinase